MSFSIYKEKNGEIRKLLKWFQFHHSAASMRYFLVPGMCINKWCFALQLFWEKRLQGLSASDVTEQIIKTMELPKGLQGIIQIQLGSTCCVPGSVLAAVGSEMMKTGSLHWGIGCLAGWCSFCVLVKPRKNGSEKLVCCRDVSDFFLFKNFGFRLGSSYKLTYVLLLEPNATEWQNFSRFLVKAASGSSTCPFTLPLT